MQRFRSARWRHEHRRVLRRATAAGTSLVFVGALSAAAVGTGDGSFGTSQVGQTTASGTLLPTNQWITPLGSRLLVNNGRLLSSSISPDGTYLAALTWNDFTGFLTIVNLKTNTIVQQIGTGNGTDKTLGDGSVAADGPLWSADGKSLWFPQAADMIRFAVGTGGTVSNPVVIALTQSTTNLNTTSTTTDDLPSGMALSPDGSRLYVALNGINKLGVIDTTTNQVVQTIDVGNAPRQVVLVGDHEATLRGFFDVLGEERCGKIAVVSADGAEWIADVVRERCLAATLCIDSFHVVQWATAALDEVRREVWNAARRGGMTEHARELKGARFALWKNPEDLTRRQRGKLAQIAKTNAPLYRAYLLKEQLRLAIRRKGVISLSMLDEWFSWAARCRIPAFVELGRKIRRHLPGIEAAMLHKVSNALVESTNTKLRVLHRMAFGFRQPEHLIALALLDRGGYCPPLPGRSTPALATLG